MGDDTLPAEVDLLVLGSGASGLTAAITARLCGLDVLVIEKDSVIGGTSAWSGGILWIPCNPHQAPAGVTDSAELARAYIRHEAGNLYDAERVDAFLAHGPRMVAFLEANTQVRFDLSTHADYHPQAAGALAYGRALRPLDFDARILGRRYFDLRTPPRARVMMGMQIGAAHIAHLLNARRSLASCRFIAQRMLSHLRDLAIHGRNMTPTMGNALTARLLASAEDLRLPIRLGRAAKALLREGGTVAGADVSGPSGETIVRARNGVVLACGGFPHDYERRKRVFAHRPTKTAHLSCAPETNTGDGIAMAEAIGAAFEGDLHDGGAWYPTSRVRYPDGSETNNPHLLERGKPGVIAVTPDGNRFTDEAQNYHDFVKAMLAAPHAAPDHAVHFICDHRALRRYGLGVARPFPFPYRGFLRSGYLLHGATVEELATRAGIAPEGLARCIDAYNAHARLGKDPQFKKGENAYDVGQGDPNHRPNPCVGPLAQPPFYAVRVLPGDLATFAGLRTDRHARVLDAEAQPIPGLYAVGNDQASVFAGAYPGGGATLGPGMTFAYIAALHAAGRADDH